MPNRKFQYQIYTDSTRSITASYKLISIGGGKSIQKKIFETIKQNFQKTTLEKVKEAGTNSIGKMENL